MVLGDDVVGSVFHVLCVPDSYLTSPRRCIYTLQVYSRAGRECHKRLTIRVRSNCCLVVRAWLLTITIYLRQDGRIFLLRGEDIVSESSNSLIAKGTRRKWDEKLNISVTNPGSREQISPNCSDMAVGTTVERSGCPSPTPCALSLHENAAKQKYALPNR